MGNYAAMVFTKSYLDEEYAFDRISPNRSKKVSSQRASDNGYEMILYHEHIEGQEDNYVTPWVAIRSLTEKGTFYMTGLELDELENFVSTCMPNLE